MRGVSVLVSLVFVILSVKARADSQTAPATSRAVNAGVDAQTAEAPLDSLMKPQAPLDSLKPGGEKLLRIGGTYKIVKIEKRGASDFQIKFQSEPLTGRYDHLVLRSDHVHMSLQEGQVLRLSAEVIAERAQELAVTQVLLFLSHAEYGTTPVWLLSSQHVTKDFRGGRWLDMHAPQADFLIL